MSVKILSSGSYLPETKVSNDDLSKIMDTSDEWIVQRTGIKNRRYENTSAAHMAYNAALEALVDIDVESIDAIIVGTYTADNLIPSVAGQVRKMLNIKKEIPAYDVNAACSGFVFAFSNAYAYIKANIYQKILVIGVDFNSRILDFSDRSTSILFGDGAGVVVLSQDETRISDSTIYSVSDTNNSLTLLNSSDYTNPFVERKVEINPYLEMEGNQVFKFAVESLIKGVKDILKRNNLEIDDIDYIISHQANIRILDTGAKMLRAKKTKFLSNISEVGNTSSASVPLLFDQENKKGIFKKKDKIIMVAFGGGLTYGSILVEY